MAANLISARYVELTPAYRRSANPSGPQLHDGAVIPIERTAVPVEWDQVKDQLMRLATDLGPNSKVSTPSIARFVDSAANALQGNGDKLRQTLAQLSGVGRILANGSGNIDSVVVARFQKTANGFLGDMVGIDMRHHEQLEETFARGKCFHTVHQWLRCRLCTAVDEPAMRGACIATAAE